MYTQKHPKFKSFIHSNTLIVLYYCEKFDFYFNVILFILILRWLLIHILQVHLFSFVITQQCTSDDFAIMKNNDILFTVSSSNKSCICESFIGDGSRLTCLNKSNIIVKVIASDNSWTTINPNAFFVVSYNTKILDTHNAYYPSTGIFIASINGTYMINAVMMIEIPSSIPYIFEWRNIC